MDTNMTGFSWFSKVFERKYSLSIKAIRALVSLSFILMIKLWDTVVLMEVLWDSLTLVILCTRS